MNMFYTGLGIARSLGQRGIRVIGLSAHSGIYGNYTRYADVRFCPDSRENPDQLLEYLVRLGDELGGKSLLYPTRDDDVLFLERFRSRLNSHFTLVIPSAPALDACLDKWETYLAARKAGVPVPRSWKIENPQDLCRSISEISFPAVLKPLSALVASGADWNQVGARKAICVHFQQWDAGGRVREGGSRGRPSARAGHDSWRRRRFIDCGLLCEPGAQARR